MAAHNLHNRLHNRLHNLCTTGCTSDAHLAHNRRTIGVHTHLYTYSIYRAGPDGPLPDTVRRVG